MKLEEFQAVIRERIPTPEEFVGFTKGQGWEIIAQQDGSAVLRADKTDALAVALAKMLSREPYRTNVLKLVVQVEANGGCSANETRRREWLWSDGRHYTEADYVAALPQYRDQHPWGATWWRYLGEKEWRKLRETKTDLRGAEGKRQQRYQKKSRRQEDVNPQF